METRTRATSKRKPSKKKTLTSRFIAQFLCQAAEDKKAENIEMIDVRKVSSVCNYYVICTVESSPQLNAVAGGVNDLLKKMKITAPKWQGNPESKWMLLDLINVVMHVMGKEERSKYRLEDIWSNGGVVYHV